jgi:DNA-binding NarL/FixJ family response regulator
MKKYGVIISQHTAASQQIANILEQHGWSCVIIDPNRNFLRFLKLQPAIFIVDIDDPACHGIELLGWFKKFNPIAYTTALCKGGNSPAMRLARNSGIDGFFYFNKSGTELDCERGVASYFSKTHAHLFANAIISQTPNRRLTET